MSKVTLLSIEIEMRKAELYIMAVVKLIRFRLQIEIILADSYQKLQIFRVLNRRRTQVASLWHPDVSPIQQKLIKT